ncbi:MAG: glycosyltransferase family 39 protein [Steroidobacter sp.]
MTFGSLNLSRRDLWIVVALFAVSRAFYGWLGLHFDASTFPGYMQFIEPSLLTQRLFESLWYYHAGPPMLNLVVGIALKMFGAQAMLAVGLLFHVLGLLLAIAVYALTCRLSHSRLAGLITAGLLVFSPAFVLYENWLMYSFPATALLTLSALALYQYVDTRRTGWCVAFFSLLTALLLTRSLFHLAWMVLVTGLLAVMMREHWRQVLRAAFIPLLVIVLWYGKNYYLFGMFGSSSWMGLGLSNIATLVTTREELQPLVEDGRLSRYALISRYSQMDQLFDPSLPPTGVPVLDQIKKPTGQYNFNYHGIIEVDRYYTHDALTVIRAYPFSYVIGMVIANRLFFSPTSMNLYFNKENRAAARPMEAVFNPLFYGVGAEPFLGKQPHFGFANAGSLEVNTSVPLILAWIVVLGYGYLQLRKALVSGTREELPRALAIGFIVLTTLYVYAISTTIELAENYRYRSLIEPLFLVLEATVITAFIRKARARFFPA